MMMMLYWQRSRFLIDKEKGWIFTNAHVSGRGNARVYVAFKGKKYQKAKIFMLILF